jgi:NADPH:quinone reductase-like Zn-dependent oxidoreductase
LSAALPPATPPVVQVLSVEAAEGPWGGAMKAAAIDGYGGPERLTIRAMPVPNPGVGKVLIRVRAAAVNPVDWKIRRGQLRLVKPASFPLILGYDVAGEIAAVGPEVTRFAQGDPVFALLDGPHGGGYAEYAVASEKAVAALPAGLSWEEGAAIPLAGTTALQALRDRGELVAGERALILGGAGGVGHFAVQIAKALGAHVTATSSARNLPFLWQLGVDRAIDYHQEEWETDDASYATVFDAVGASSFAEAEPVLAEDGGIYVTTLPGPAAFLAALKTTASRLWGKQQRARWVVARAKAEDLAVLARWAERGQLRPAIERVFPLDEIAQAHTLSEGGRVRGKLVVRIP